jgi:hypothetical protein
MLSTKVRRRLNWVARALEGIIPNEIGMTDATYDAIETALRILEKCSKNPPDTDAQALLLCLNAIKESFAQ